MSAIHIKSQVELLTDSEPTSMHFVFDILVVSLLVLNQYDIYYEYPTIGLV